MTITELERAAADLAVVDHQLATIPARGRVAAEIQATRAHVAETARLVRLCLREQRAAAGLVPPPAPWDARAHAAPPTREALSRPGAATP